MADKQRGRSSGIRDAVTALKRERTVAVAAKLFYDRGYENTSLDAVAEGLGVTKPFIYAYFTSKSELLAEICSRGIASSLEAIDSVISQEMSASGKLHLLSRRFVTAVLENQMNIAIFSREEKNLAQADFERINAMRRDFDRKLTALLNEGVETGEFSLSNAHMAALAIGGMVSWTYVWYRPTGALSVDELAAEISNLIMHMTGAAETKTIP